MIFKDRKTPKHLIIQEEFEFGHKPKFNIFRILIWSGLAACLAYALLLSQY